MIANASLPGSPYVFYLFKVLVHCSLQKFEQLSVSQEWNDEYFERWVKSLQQIIAISFFTHGDIE